MLKTIMGKIGNSVDVDTEFRIPVFGTDKEVFIKVHTQRRGENRYIIKKNPIYTGLSEVIKTCEKVHEGFTCPIETE